MTPRELAWAAGLFEGEGTIRINKATRRNLGHLVVAVTNTDRQVVEYFDRRWPATVSPVHGLGPRRRPAWVWTIASLRAAAVLRDLLPFFETARVIEKARYGLIFQQGKSLRHAVCRSEAYRAEQFGSYLWMKELNLRGARS